MSSIGFRRIALFKKNGVNFDNLVCPFLRSPAQLNLAEKKDLKEQRNRVLPTYTNVKGTFKDYCTNRPALYYYMQLANTKGGIDAEFLAEKTSSSTYDGVYTFPKLGLSFKYTQTEKDRFTDVTLESSYPDDRFKAIIDAAQLDDPASIPGTGQVEYNILTYRKPSLASIIIAGSELFSPDEIKSYKVEVSNEGEKNYLGVLHTSWYAAAIELNIMPIAKDRIKQILDVTKNPSIAIISDINTSGLEKLNFDTGVLSLSREFNLADDKQETKLFFDGRLPVGCVSFPVETGNDIYSFSL